MRVHLLLVLAMILGGSLLAPAEARPDRQERQALLAERGPKAAEKQKRKSRKGVLTRDEAARRVQRKYGGRVLSVDLLQSDDAPARYRVKLLTDGNVRTVDVNALED